jgi:hypothetical protein
MKMAESSGVTDAVGSSNAQMPGSVSSADSSFAMNISSLLTEPSFISPAYGSLSDGVYETGSNQIYFANYGRDVSLPPENVSLSELL